MSRQERVGISDPHDVWLELGKVRRWLEDKAPEQVCGTSNTWGACPLATYLREAHDAYDIRVGEHTYRMMLPEGDTGDCPLPDWARRFVDYVDAGPDLRRVTAAEALELLERAAPPRVGTDPEGGAGRSTPGGQMSSDAVRGWWEAMEPLAVCGTSNNSSACPGRGVRQVTAAEARGASGAGRAASSSSVWRPNKSRPPATSMDTVPPHTGQWAKPVPQESLREPRRAHTASLFWRRRCQSVRPLLRLPQTAIVHQAPERFLRVRLLAAELGVALDDEALIFYDIRDLMSVPLRLQRALPRRAGRSGVG